MTRGGLFGSFKQRGWIETIGEQMAGAERVNKARHT